MVGHSLGDPRKCRISDRIQKPDHPMWSLISLEIKYFLFHCLTFRASQMLPANLYSHISWHLYPVYFKPCAERSVPYAALYFCFLCKEEFTDLLHKLTASWTSPEQTQSNPGAEQMISAFSNNLPPVRWGSFQFQGWVQTLTAIVSIMSLGNRRFWS